MNDEKQIKLEALKCAISITQPSVMAADSEADDVIRAAKKFEDYIYGREVLPPIQGKDNKPV